LKSRATRKRFSIAKLPDYQITNLFHFFMRRVLPATLAKLLHLDPVRSRLSILGGRVVALFAVTALHRNDFSGH
jgi:hypothetical protein